MAYGTAWMYMRYTIPEYEVKCSILIKDTEKSSGVSETALLKELGAYQETKNVDNEIQILKSQTLMESVVRDLNLIVRYYAVGRVRNEEMYGNSYVRVDSFDLKKGGALLNIHCLSDSTFELIEEKNTSAYRFGQWIQTAQGHFILNRDFSHKLLDEGRVLIQIHSVESLARQYTKRLIVKPLSFLSSVLEMRLQEPIARRAADILNKLVEVYNRAEEEDKNKVSKNTIQFIDQRLLYLTNELSKVESGVQVYKQRNQIATDVESGMGMVLEDMARFDQEIAQKEVNSMVLRSLESYMEPMKSGEYQLLPANLNAEDKALNELLRLYNEKVLILERLKETAKAQNPALISVQQEVSNLHENVLESVERLIAKEDAQKKNAELSRKLLSGKVLEAPRKERELLEIMRQQNIKQNLYLFLLQKREETQLALASTTASARVVDPARPNNTPVKPQKKLVYILAILIGLVFPGLFVLLKDLLNDTVQSEAEIRNSCQVPTLGSIAFSRSRKQIVVTPGSRSPVAEMFRLLRTNMQFILPPANDTKARRILVTSTASGDGKTFVTANLGMALAISGKKTVLVELDLRKPKLSKYLGMDSSNQGITHYLLGHENLESIVRPSNINENLFVVSSGPTPPNPAELVMYPALDKLMENLSASFDYILIDTPPVGLVADAMLLNRFVEASIYVVRQGSTKKGMLRLLKEVYSEKKLNNIGAVLNGFKRSDNVSTAYGYGYGYGYYEPEKSRISEVVKRVVGFFKKNN